jgi:hypothetical protein
MSSASPRAVDVSAWLTTAAPLAGLGADVAIQIAVARASGRIGTSIVSGALTGAVATTAVLVANRSGIAAGAVAIVTFLALAFCFWTFLNLNVTSLRIRILREVLHAGGSVSAAQLAAQYSDDEFLSRRLARLEAAKQLSFVGGRWRLESRVLLILARTMDAARFIVLPRQRDE